LRLGRLFKLSGISSLIKLSDKERYSRFLRFSKPFGIFVSKLFARDKILRFVRLPISDGTSVI